MNKRKKCDLNEKFYGIENLGRKKKITGKPYQLYLSAAVNRINEVEDKMQKTSI